MYMTGVVPGSATPVVLVTETVSAVSMRAAPSGDVAVIMYLAMACAAISAMTASASSVPAIEIVTVPASTSALTPLSERSMVTVMVCSPG